MPLLTVQPDDLTAAAALTGRDADGLDEAARLVVAAGRQATEALTPGNESVLSALAGYVHVETTVGSLLGEAARVLATGMSQAGSRYAATESAVLDGFGRLP